MYLKKRKPIWRLALMLLVLLGSGFGLYQTWATGNEYPIYLPFVQQSVPFAKTENSPLYLQNATNEAGCDWMGVGGEILNASGQPILDEGFLVHVWGSGIDVHVTSGSQPVYGPNGWEVYLFNTPVQNAYYIQLKTPDQVSLSAVYQFESRSSCNQNLILFNFIENNP